MTIIGICHGGIINHHQHGGLLTDVTDYRHCSAKANRASKSHGRAGGQAGRRAGGQAGRRAGGQAGRRAGGQAGRRAGGQAGRRAGGQAGRRAGGQAGRRAGGQADRRTGGQADRQARRPSRAPGPCQGKCKQDASQDNTYKRQNKLLLCEYYYLTEFNWIATPSPNCVGNPGWHRTRKPLAYRVSCYTLSPHLNIPRSFKIVIYLILEHIYTSSMNTFPWQSIPFIYRSLRKCILSYV